VQAPERIPPYRLEGLLGSGATSRVYRAVHEETGEVIALKVLDTTGDDARVRAYFAREVELLRDLDHPGIVGFRATGQHDGGPWLAMELIGGAALEDRLDSGPIPWPEAVTLFRDLAGILAYLHDRGFTHRDLKPANLIIGERGQVRLIDLGIAATIAPDALVSFAGLGAGTPRTMSPEQVLGQPATAASDIYSAGICLFEALTGESPYLETTQAALLAAHVQRSPRPLSDLLDAPAALTAIITVCLAKQASSRYDSALDLAADLSAVLVDERVLSSATHAGRKLGLRSEGELYGRTNETRVITRWLERGRTRREPTALIVRGPAGSGRSAIVRWAARTARRLGYALDGEAAAAATQRLRLRDQADAELVPAPGEHLLAAVAEDWEAPADVEVTVIDLAPLGPGAIARWARDAVDLDRLARRDRDLLVRETAGLPGRIEPLLFRWRELARRGEAPPPGQLGALLEATDDERSRIERRLGALEAGRRLLLELAAVLDPCALPARELAEVTGAETEDLTGLLAGYLRAGLSVALDGDRLIFRDRVLPGVIRRVIDPVMHGDLNTAAIELLEPLETGEALRRRAELVTASGDVTAAEPIAWRAGRRLYTEGRTLEAAELIVTWVDRGERPLSKDEVDLTGDCARTLRGAGQQERIAPLLAATSARAPAELVARLESERAGSLFTSGDYDEARPIYLSNALRAQRAGDANLRLRSLVMLATIAQLTGRPDRAMRIYRRLEQLADAVEPFLLVTWLRRRGGLALKVGRDDESKECLERAWSVARAHGLDDELMLAQETAMGHLTRGDRAAAWTLLEEGLQGARARGRSDMLAWLQHVVALHHLQAGDVDRGEQAVRSSSHWAHKTGLYSLLADNHELMARITSHRGHLDAARRAIRLARRYDSGNDNIEAQLRLHEVDHALREGDQERAQTRLEAADQLDRALDPETRVVRDTIALLVASYDGADDVEARFDRLRPRLAVSWSAFRSDEIAGRLARGRR